MFIIGSVGYVSQNHWLRNKSVRDNILFGKNFVSEFYEFCLEICELKADLKNFENGDESLIASNGANLSGGQKQRISICRAIYQE
jgi:ABC-type bacteriocin/lantibiotic exporter with double-glycine peptidase domain